MKYAIELLELERLKLRAHVRTILRNQDVIMSNIPHTVEDAEVADIEEALSVLRTPTEEGRP